MLHKRTKHSIKQILQGTIYEDLMLLTHPSVFMAELHRNPPYFTCRTLCARRCDFQKHQSFAKQKGKNEKTAALYCGMLLLLQNLFFIVATLIISNFTQEGRFCKPVRCPLLFRRGEVEK